MTKLTLATLPAALLLVPSLAAAETYSKSDWPTAANQRPLTRAKGMIEVDADLYINLSKDRVGEPLGLAPDIHYGVDDRLTVSLIHDRGLCLSGEDKGCAKVYDDVGVRATYGLSSSEALALAVHGELKIASIDGGTLALPIGARARFNSGKIGVYADPTISLGLTDRDAGNPDSLALPISIAYQTSPELLVHLDTGLGGFLGTSLDGAAQLDNLGDTFAVPLGVGALYTVSTKLDVGARLTFPYLFGSELANDIGIDSRVLYLHANLRI
ncbi:MAG: hypothetical protein R2939_08705 [Kofleriaceae bacterium]